MDFGCQSGIVHHPQDEKPWLKALREHAAQQAFPDWQPESGDWTSLYTSFEEDGQPYTEVAVYRDHTRIHYARIEEPEMAAFWARLLQELSE